jgi:hypothetical protein
MAGGYLPHAENAPHYTGGYRRYEANFFPPGTMIPLHVTGMRPWPGKILKTPMGSTFDTHLRCTAAYFGP